LNKFIFSRVLATAGLGVGGRFVNGSSFITLKANDGNIPPIPPDVGLHTNLRALGFEVKRDSRPNRFYPLKGSVIDFTGNFFASGLGSKYSFQSYKFRTGIEAYSANIVSSPRLSSRGAITDWENCLATTLASRLCSTASAKLEDQFAGGTMSTAAGKPRPELWETSRGCNQGHVNGIFSSFEDEMGAVASSQDFSANNVGLWLSV
jgi:hypothetical protein